MEWMGTLGAFIYETVTLVEFRFFALSCLLSHARLELQMIQVSVT